MAEYREVKIEKEIDIRFSEVDSMKVVWHGNYIKYFEDAREAFGDAYGLGYLDIYAAGCYLPLVDISVKFLHPLTFGRKAVVSAVWRPCEAAKLVFDYEIRDAGTGELAATGHSTQVFMDHNYQLLWTAPEFFENWKKKWIVK